MDKQHTTIALSQILNALMDKGIDNELIMNENNEMVCAKLYKKYEPEDLLIFKKIRFEDESNPDDNSIILMIQNIQGNIGYILNSYRAYRNFDGPELDDFIKQIPTRERENLELFQEN